MSKIAVVFWSDTGNIEAMADAVIEGIQSAGGETEKIHASDFSAGAVDDYDALAFGCPAKGSEELEEEEFEPMFARVENVLSGKKIALFGSHDWGTGDWMDTWKERTEQDGAEIIDTVITQLTPDDEALAACKELGKRLV